jgi:hypothetical protein
LRVLNVTRRKEKRSDELGELAKVEFGRMFPGYRVVRLIWLLNNRHERTIVAVKE